MKAIVAYKEAWKDISKYRYPIIFLFLVNILFTFIVTSPFTLFFKHKHMYSDSLDQYKGYDISAVMEFVNNYGEGMLPLNVLFFQFVIAYFILGIFTNAGLVYSVISQNRIILIRSFLNGGLNFFWKILRLSLYYLIGIVVILFMVWKILLLMNINILEAQDDRELANKLLVGILISFVFFSIISAIKQYAKVVIAIDKTPLISTSILKSGKFMFSHFRATIFLYLLNISSLVIIFFLYVLIRNSLNVNGWVILFILSQFLLIAKIIIRIIHLDSSYRLFKVLK